MSRISIALIVSGICILYVLWNSVPESFATGTFLHQNKIVHTAELELAETPQQIQQGLMFRTHLPPHSGMLFLFGEEAYRSFWMRNTLVNLDMVFVTSAGRIANIHSSVPPNTEDLRASSEPVQYVVELPGGTTKKYGIQTGDQFLWN